MPVFLNVNWKVFPLDKFPDSKVLSSAVMVWFVDSLLVQVTVAPFWTVRVVGLKDKLAIVTEFGAVATEEVLVDEVLYELQPAPVKTKAIANVPINKIIFFPPSDLLKKELRSLLSARLSEDFASLRI